MKVSFSASYWQIPCVREFLDSCDLIYSQNIDRSRELRELFGERIQFIPSGTAVYDWLYARHEDEDDEVFTYTSLRQLIREAIADDDYYSIYALAQHRFQPIITENNITWQVPGYPPSVTKLGQIPDEVRDYLKRNF